MKAHYLYSMFLFVFLLIVATPLFAQPTPPSAPIDGGLSLLIAGGVGYGIKKIYERKNKN